MMIKFLTSNSEFCLFCLLSNSAILYESIDTYACMYYYCVKYVVILNRVIVEYSKYVCMRLYFSNLWASMLDLMLEAHECKLIVNIYGNFSPVNIRII